MTQSSQHFRQYITYSPVDWGIGVARTHWRILVLLSLPVFTAELLAGYFLYIAPLTPKLVFMVSVMLNGAYAWLLSAFLMYLISVMRHEYYSLGVLSRRALAFLPKVFISYSLFSLLVSIGIRVPPALVMLFFFMWAPAYCAAETYAAKPDEEDEYEDEDEEEFDPEYGPELRIKHHSFIGSAPWDLGGARSMQLVSQHLIPSLQVFVLYWAAVVIPVAMVYASTPEPLGLASQLLQFFLSALFAICASAIWAGAYLSLLSESCFEELGLLPEQFHNDLLEGRRPRQLTGLRPGVFIFIAILALISSLYYARMAHMVEPLPASVVFETQRVNREGDTLVVKVRLSDTERQYRWLEMENFRVVFDASRIAGIRRGEGGKELPEPKGVQPHKDRALVYDDNGKLLDPAFFKPHYGEIELVLRFPISPKVGRDNRVFLYYGKEAKHGQDEPLYNGALPPDELKK